MIEHSYLEETKKGRRPRKRWRDDAQ